MEWSQIFHDITTKHDFKAMHDFLEKATMKHNYLIAC